MIKIAKPLEVKKLENGTIAVRWSDSPKKWSIVTDSVMARFIVFKMTGQT